MAAKQAEVKRVVYASSSGIFGAPHYAPMDEAHPTHPTSPYGVSKLAGEKYCLAFHEVYGVNLTCLRYYSVYGPRGRPDQVLYAFTSAILRDESPTIFGDGGQTRDFTHVSDIVDATVRAAECKEACGEVFNIGFGREYSINDVFSTIVNKLEKTEEIEPIYHKSYGGEFPRTLAENSKAKQILGWKPKMEFNAGVDTFLEWFLKNNKLH
jgi:UDP-glucose 4-epimerase